MNDNIPGSERFSERDAKAEAMEKLIKLNDELSLYSYHTVFQRKVESLIDETVELGMAVANTPSPDELKRVVSRPKFALEQRQVNTYVRNELRKNMTNLPERWVELALSDDFCELEDIAFADTRIINRNTLDVIKAY